MRRLHRGTTAELDAVCRDRGLGHLGVFLEGGDQSPRNVPAGKVIVDVQEDVEGTKAAEGEQFFQSGRGHPCEEFSHHFGVAIG